MDATAFLKVLLDPDRLAVVGLVAAGPRTIEELADQTGHRRAMIVATLAPLAQAGIVVRDGERYALRREALRELARDLPRPPPPDRELFSGMTAGEQAVLARFFRGERLVEIPAQRTKRLVVLERIALDFEPGRRYAEKEVNLILAPRYPDYATLRRLLVDEGFLDRAEGQYWRSGGRVEPGGGVQDSAHPKPGTARSMRDSFEAYNVIAAFPDMDAARHAIGALEEKGVDAGAISLLGRAAEEAQQKAEQPYRDEAFLDKATRTGVGGAAAGTAVGGTAGFLAGLAAFGVPGIGPVVAGGIWATTLGGAFAGGGVGLAATAYAKIKQSEAWELAYKSVSSDQAIVGVHSDREDEVAAAAEILQQQGPERLDEFDAEGRRIHIE